VGGFLTPGHGHPNLYSGPQPLHNYCFCKGSGTMAESAGNASEEDAPIANVNFHRRA